MFVFLIILGVIIYLLIAWAVFRICAANDVFEEFSGRRIYEFPTGTFIFSLFWIIAFPVSLICAFFCWIAEEIECWGYAYYKANIIKKQNKKEDDK